MSPFWPGLATGVIITVIVCMIIARYMAKRLTNKAHAKLEEIANEFTEQAGLPWSIGDILKQLGK